MLPLKTLIKNQLNNSSRIALLGVGSELRGDDAAGIIVARKLLKEFKSTQDIRVFIGDTAPENLTGEIKRFKPSHLIIVDCADLKEKPGTVKLLIPERTGGFSASTHKMPMKVLTDYLIDSTGCKIIIIGVQPGIIEFGSKPSPAILKTARLIASAISAAISKGQFSQKSAG